MSQTLRSSYNKSEDKKAIHMISAWASEKQVVLGQLKTEEKSNENPEQKRFSMPWAHPQANSKLSWLLLLGAVTQVKNLVYEYLKSISQRVIVIYEKIMHQMV